MPSELVPQKSIVPIVRATEDFPIVELLGTGFFVGSVKQPQIVTAKHVFVDNPLQEGEKYGVAFREESGIRILAIEEIIGSPVFDIAIFNGLGFPEAVPLQIGKSDPALNSDVLTFEYSLTRIEREPSGTRRVFFEPIAHKGNVMQIFKSTYPDQVETPCFITSFPALQGASGAPLIMGTTLGNFAVVGMLVANVEHHLMPAQIVTIQEGAKYSEKTEYYLPLGKALARSVIENFLKEMKIPFSYAKGD